ncbi:proline-rich extensin-like protein EPR1 [Gastrolobium bilobum]|uniref:proline-rich extensin-like protein EPR1 n=1 Tax=Gastrolobium bilobum TaxID=150636 RepID=UPI002AB1CAB1|nr:proline-rich extensin-like protein EPR1 [Gastrolobium bilobum]
MRSLRGEHTNPEGQARTVHSSSSPSVQSAPTPHAVAMTLPPILQSVGAPLPMADNINHHAGNEMHREALNLRRVAPIDRHVAIREVQEESSAPAPPPPSEVHYGMTIPVTAPQRVPPTIYPQPLRSQPVVVYIDQGIPIATRYPPGPHIHIGRGPYPVVPITPEIPFHGYTVPPHNATVAQPQGSYMILAPPPPPPPLGVPHALAPSYSVHHQPEAQIAPRPPPEAHVQNLNTRTTPVNPSGRNKPLIDSLRLTPIPLGFKGPTNMTTYVGDTDPFE